MDVLCTTGLSQQSSVRYVKETQSPVLQYVPLHSGFSWLLPCGVTCFLPALPPSSLLFSVNQKVRAQDSNGDSTLLATIFQGRAVYFTLYHILGGTLCLVIQFLMMMINGFRWWQHNPSMVKFSSILLLMTIIAWINYFTRVFSNSTILSTFRRGNLGILGIL